MSFLRRIYDKAVERLQAVLISTYIEYIRYAKFLSQH